MAATPPKTSKSVLKRDRQNKKKRVINKAVRSSLKTLTKKLLTTLETKKTDTEGSEAQKMTDVPLLLKHAVRAFDKASSKGIIHANNASRHISRLSARVQSFMRAHTV